MNTIKPAVPTVLKNARRVVRKMKASKALRARTGFFGRS